MQRFHYGLLVGMFGAALLGSGGCTNATGDEPAPAGDLGGGDTGGDPSSSDSGDAAGGGDPSGGDTGGGGDPSGGDTGGNTDPAGSDSGGSDTEPGGGEPGGMIDDNGVTDPIDEDCQGIDLVGLKYSPGGNVLPNTCEPFDNFTNNPYAIRCVDAMPDYETPYPGDEFCILPPPPDQGIQTGVWPGEDARYWEKMHAGDYSDYFDDALNAESILEAGGETDQNYYTTATNSEPFKYYRVNWRMRTGSHHMIITLSGDQLNEGWVGGRTGANINGPNTIGSLGGAQRPDQDRPLGSLEVPPEDTKIGFSWRANQSITYNMHHFNVTDGPILREAWVNTWKKPESEVEEEALSIFTMNPIHVLAPGQVQDLHSVVPITQPTRIMYLFGHRHAWTPRFHVWVEYASGDSELVYDSYDWFDMPTYSYDSLADNPVPDPAAKIDGGYSGVLQLEPGDELHYNCRQDATQARQDQIGQTAPSIITFGNEAFDAEMCILFGMSVGARLPRSPQTATTPVQFQN